jgi:hypothetical protein
MGTKRSVVGTFFGVNLAGLVLTTAIPAFAQDNSTATTGQQGGDRPTGAAAPQAFAPSSCAPGN